MKLDNSPLWQGCRQEDEALEAMNALHSLIRGSIFFWLTLADDSKIPFSTGVTYFKMVGLVTIRG